MTHELPRACADSDLHLVALAYGETADVPADVRAHVASCTRCKAELDAIAETRAFAQQLPFDEPSEELDARILAAADDFLAGREIGPPPVAVVEAPAAKVVPLFDAARAPSAPARIVDREPAPPVPFAPPKKSPRRWLGPLAAAAVLGLVIGGTSLLTGTRNLATYAPAEQAMAPAPVAAPGEAVQPEGRKELLEARADSNAVAPAPELEKKRDERKPEPAKRKAEADTLLDGIGGGGDVGKGALNGLGGLGLQGAGTGGGGAGYGSGLGQLGARGRGGPAPDVTTTRPADDAADAPAAALTEERPPKAAAPPPPPASPAPAPIAPARLEEARGVADLERTKDESVEAESERAAAVPVAQPMAKKTASVPQAAASSLANPELSRWQRYVEMARVAARQNDHARAEQLYALVAGSPEAPPPLVEEALAGRSESLFRLGREDEAIAVAELLATRFPARAGLPEDLRRRARVAPAAEPALTPTSDR